MVHAQHRTGHSPIGATLPVASANALDHQNSKMGNSAKKFQRSVLPKSTVRPYGEWRPIKE